MGLHPRFRLPPVGAFRELRSDELRLFREHLLRLDTVSRRDRFNGATDDHFVQAYSERCFQRGVTVIAYVENGHVRGAAEIHECMPGYRDTAEIAFSVEDGWQRLGIGSLLFERLIDQARGLGYAHLLVTTHPHNEAMKALARKFGARLSFHDTEAVGLIELGRATDTPPGLPLAAGTRPQSDAKPILAVVATAP